MSNTGCNKLTKIIHKELSFSPNVWIGYLPDEDHDVYEIRDIEEINNKQIQWLSSNTEIHAISANYESKIIISLRFPKK